MALNINPDISKASNLSTEFYLDPKYFSLCKENIFSNNIARGLSYESLVIGNGPVVAENRPSEV